MWPYTWPTTIGYEVTPDTPWSTGTGHRKSVHLAAGEQTGTAGICL